MTTKRNAAVLVGIAGSHNAFSLSLYNLKSYAHIDPAIRRDWDIQVIQHPLIAPTREEKEVPPLIERIVEANPMLVGFSCYMWNVEAFRLIGKALREKLPETKIVWGGPEMATDYLEQGLFDDYEMDYCISGEGELTFLELLRNLSAGKPKLAKIAGLSHRQVPDQPMSVNGKRKPFKTLLDIPSPFLSGVVDDEVVMRSKVEGNIETQRGCSLRCAYCVYHKDMSKISYSAVDRTLDEVRYLINKGVKRLRFVDANFTSDLEHAKEILRGMIRERFETTLMFELIPGFIDEELAALMGEFNALYPHNEITVGVGVQTINLAVLKRMRRAIRLNRFEMTFDLLQKYKVYAKIDLIIGLPGEDMASIEQTLEYMLEKLRHGQEHLLCCHVMRGLPGTQLLDIAREYEMEFSSLNEPHELIQSPILPRQDMVKCLRRTAVVFRLTNHRGWADREFISGRRSADVSIRDAFFDARDRLGISNVQLVDLIVDGLMDHLGAGDSWFANPDFPYAETWWWNYSAIEVRNKWLQGYLTDLQPYEVPEPLAV
jgi:radical SAM superfamily enzyme YgiQ (UPF0313 family)